MSIDIKASRAICESVTFVGGCAPLGYSERKLEEFTAHARAALPQALDELEAARAEVETLRKENARLHDELLTEKGLALILRTDNQRLRGVLVAAQRYTLRVAQQLGSNRPGFVGPNIDHLVEIIGEALKGPAGS